MQIASTKNEHAESGVTGKTMAALLATCARLVDLPIQGSAETGDGEINPEQERERA